MKKYGFIILCAFMMASCVNNNGEKNGKSTPIDSSNVSGKAPATYGASNPSDDTMPKTNVDDTATKANNVHNAGTYEHH